MDMDIETIDLKAEVTFPSHALYLKGKSEQANEKLHLYLHGYGENSEVFAKRLTRTFKPQYDSLFVNGPFPIPTIKDDIVLYQFAWYFFNPIEKKYYVDFKTSIHYLKNLAKQFSAIQEKPLTIIGYSQGGYLAPFLGSEFNNTERVISINASIREDMLPEKLNFHLNQIHAKKDERVEYDLAKERFEKIKHRTLSSEWLTLPDERHYLSEEMIKALVKIID